MTSNKNKVMKIPSTIYDTIKDNQLLFVIIGAGIVLIGAGFDSLYDKMWIAVGAAFIIAEGV